MWGRRLELSKKQQTFAIFPKLALKPRIHRNKLRSVLRSTGMPPGTSSASLVRSCPISAHSSRVGGGEESWESADIELLIVFNLKHCQSKKGTMHTARGTGSLIVYIRMEERGCLQNVVLCLNEWTVWPGLDVQHQKPTDTLTVIYLAMYWTQFGTAQSFSSWAMRANRPTPSEALPPAEGLCARRGKKRLTNGWNLHWKQKGLRWGGRWAVGSRCGSRKA